MEDKIKIKYFFKLIKLCYCKQKAYFIGIIALTVIQSIVPVLSLYFLQNILNGLQIIKVNYAYIILYFSGILIAKIFNVLSTYLQNIFKIKIFYDINCEIIKISNQLSLKDYEDSDTYDKLRRALQESAKPFTCLQIIFLLAGNIISLTSYIVLLSRWNANIILPIFFIAVLSFYNTLKIGKYEFSVLQKRSSDARKVSYYSSLLNNAITFKENKTLGIDKQLFNKYKETSKKFVEKDKEIARKKTILNTLYKVIASIFGCAIVLVILKECMVGKIRFGNVYTYISCVWNILNEMDSTTANAAFLLQNTLYLKNLFDFLERDTEGVETYQNKFQLKNIDTVEFKNVSFRYRDDLPYILKDISFKISRGEKIAVIGKNGSGKSTICKLIAGFYNDYEGEILINNISLKIYSHESVLRKINILFQDFTKYEFTLLENLRFGANESENIVGKVIENGLLKFTNRLYNGVNTQLGNRFDNGIQLSGGEWQQLSFAREVIRAADIYIFDEPTANMDIETESDIFNAMQRLTANKTCFLVTHRLYNVQKFAERIMVFKEGRLIEDDSLENLKRENSYFNYLCGKTNRTDKGDLYEN